MSCEHEARECGSDVFVAVAVRWLLTSAMCLVIRRFIDDLEAIFISTFISSGMCRSLSPYVSMLSNVCDKRVGKVNEKLLGT